MATTDTLSADEMAAHVHWVRRVARALVRGDAADDVEQETWLSALRHPPHGVDDVRRWLAAVARNVVCKLARGESRRTAHERRAAQEAARSGGEAPASDLLVARAQLQQRVAAAVLELAEPYRSTLLARFFEELPPAAIAAKLGAPIETVKTRQKRGLELLRERLAAELGDEEGGRGDGPKSLTAALALLDAPIEQGLPDAPSDGVGEAAANAATSTVAGSPLLLLAAGIVLVAAMAFVLSSTKGDGGADVSAPAAAVASAVPSEEERSDSLALAAIAEPVATRLADSPSADAVEATAASAAPAAPATALAGSIRGVVVGPDGEPVGGATLWLDRQAEGRMRGESSFLRNIGTYHDRNGDGTPSWQSATSADDGSFRFDDVARDEIFAIGAAHDAAGCGWVGGLVLDAATAEREALVELCAGVVLHGTVTDPDGKPLAGVVAKLFGSSGAEDPQRFRFGGEWTTDADGRYRTASLPWRKVHACVMPMTLETMDLLRCETHEVPAIPEGAREWQHDIVVPRIVRIEGAIVGLDGAPARLASTLLPRMTDGERLRQSRETIAVVALDADPRTDAAVLARVEPADGSMRVTVGGRLGWGYGSIDFERDRYSVLLREAGTRWLALVARDGLLGIVALPDESELVDGVGPELPIDPSLLKGAPRMVELLVRARDAEGQPKEHVSIRAFSAGFDERGRPSHASPSVRPLGSPVAAGAMPIDEPADQRLALEPGDWWLECYGGVAANRYVRLSLREGMEPLDLTVAFADARGGLVGVVVAADGTPAAEAKLRLYRIPVEARAEPNGGVGSPGETDLAGRFSITEAAAVPSLLVVSSDGHAPLVLRVDPAASGAAIAAAVPIEARLASGHEIAIRVRREDDATLGYTRWQLLDGDGVPLIDDDYPRWTRSLHWGATSTVRLLAGSYRLIVRGPDGLRGEAEFTVETRGSEHAEVRGATVSSNGEVLVTVSAR